MAPDFSGRDVSGALFHLADHLSQVVLAIDDDGRIASGYDPQRAIPVSVIVDRRGHIVSVHDGCSAENEQLLDAEVARALAKTDAAPVDRHGRPSAPRRLTLRGVSPTCQRRHGSKQDVHA